MKFLLPYVDYWHYGWGEIPTTANFVDLRGNLGLRPTILGLPLEEATYITSSQDRAMELAYNNKKVAYVLKRDYNLVEVMQTINNPIYDFIVLPYNAERRSIYLGMLYSNINLPPIVLEDFGGNIKDDLLFYVSHNIYAAMSMEPHIIGMKGVVLHPMLGKQVEIPWLSIPKQGDSSVAEYNNYVFGMWCEGVIPMSVRDYMKEEWTL